MRLAPTFLFTCLVLLSVLATAQPLRIDWNTDTKGKVPPVHKYVEYSHKDGWVEHDNHLFFITHQYDEFAYVKYDKSLKPLEATKVSYPKKSPDGKSLKFEKILLGKSLVHVLMSHTKKDITTYYSFHYIPGQEEVLPSSCTALNVPKEEFGRNVEIVRNHDSTYVCFLRRDGRNLRYFNLDQLLSRNVYHEVNSNMGIELSYLSISNDHDLDFLSYTSTGDYPKSTEHYTYCHYESATKKLSKQFLFDKEMSFGATITGWDKQGNVYVAMFLGDITGAKLGFHTLYLVKIDTKNKQAKYVSQAFTESEIKTLQDNEAILGQSMSNKYFASTDNGYGVFSFQYSRNNMNPISGSITGSTGYILHYCFSLEDLKVKPIALPVLTKVNDGFQSFEVFGGKDQVNVLFNDHPDNYSASNVRVSPNDAKTVSNGNLRKCGAYLFSIKPDKMETTYQPLLSGGKNVTLYTLKNASVYSRPMQDGSYLLFGDPGSGELCAGQLTVK